MGKKEIKQLECQCENHKGKNPLAITNFYNSNSPMAKEGKSPFCKKCIKEMIDYNDVNTIYTVLTVMDLPFIYDLWDKVKNSDKDVFGNYLRQVNSLPQFQGLKWKDSIFESTNEANKKMRMSSDSKKAINTLELENLKDKFGYGYPDDEYFLFEKKYNELRPSFQLPTTMHEECLREYCVDKVKESLAKARGDFKEAKAWADMAKEQASSGKLNPSQMSKSDLSGGLNTFGEMARMVEEKPEGEFLEVLPKFTERPKDKVDVTLWMYVNYVRALKDMPDCEYKEIWKFYKERVDDYEKNMADITFDYGEEDDEE